jgi:hypothetical protein
VQVAARGGHRGMPERLLDGRSGNLASIKKRSPGETIGPVTTTAIQAASRRSSEPIRWLPATPSRFSRPAPEDPDGGVRRSALAPLVGLSVGWPIGLVETACPGPPLLFFDPPPLFSRSTPAQLLVRPPRKAVSCNHKCQDFAIALFKVACVFAADGDLATWEFDPIP